MGYQRQFQKQPSVPPIYCMHSLRFAAFRVFHSYPVEDPAFAGHPLGDGFSMGLLLRDVMVVDFVFIY